MRYYSQYFMLNINTEKKSKKMEQQSLNRKGLIIEICFS